MSASQILGFLKQASFLDLGRPKTKVKTLAFPKHLVANVINAIIGSAPHAVRGLEMWARLRNKIATPKVTIVPKQIHHGNSITGSQFGWV